MNSNKTSIKSSFFVKLGSSSEIQDSGFYLTMFNTDVEMLTFRSL